MAYALRSDEQETIVLPKNARPKHVCGEYLTQSDQKGRYVCTRCLQSGYLLPE